MKFRDVKTLEHLLKEYGSEPGGPAYNMGGTLNKIGNVASKAKDIAKDQAAKQKSNIEKGKQLSKGNIGVMGSPPASPSVDGPKKSTMVSVMAKDLDDGSPFKDENGKEVGTVVSKIGNLPNTDKVVVKKASGDYELFDPNVSVMIDEDLSHDILKKVTKQKASKKNSIARRIKRLSRQRLGEQELFEINFNQKSQVEKALDAPIRCGFEAETSWDGLSGTGSSEQIDDLSWYDVQNQLYVSNRDEEYVDEAFNEYVRENLTPDYYEDAMDTALENEREDDENYARFMEDGDGPTVDAVQEYKDNMQEEDPKEYENREEDGWEFINWAREFIDEEYEDDFIMWLREYVDSDGDVFQQAFDEAYGDTSIDEWISNEYYSMSSFCDDFGIDYSELSGGGLDEVADIVGEWARDNSIETDHPETGDYGDTSTDGWAVEIDSSIESDGAGAEIISPVYSTPRQMLEEMRSMFKMFENNGGRTNDSTGLHVTMSWNGENPRLKSEPDKLKMASLLGDRYLLDTFGRENNGYAKSQQQFVQKAALKVKNGDLSDLERLKSILGKGISGDKFSSINFKSQKDSSTGTNLIEFRIGGGYDYHTTENFATVTKAVVRYATIMEAGYTNEFEDDYAKAIARIVNTAGQIDPSDVERAKAYGYEDIESPVINLFKEMLSKDNYLDGIGEIYKAYKELKDYNNLESQDQNNLREALDSVKDEKLKDAQIFYCQALGRLAVDVYQDKNRRSINAKSIAVIRSSLKEFEIDESKLTPLIGSVLTDINIPTQNDRQDQKFVVIDAGLKKLFKKDVLVKPHFLKSPQVDSMVKKLWNAINSKDYEQNDIIGQYLADIIHPDGDKDKISNGKLSWQTASQKREYNQFYSDLSRGGYNASDVLLPVGAVYNKEKFKELSKLLDKYETYNQPVSVSHSTTFHSDDSYIENYLNKYTMRLRKRFVYLQELQNTDLAMYFDSLKKIGAMLEPFVQAVAIRQDVFDDPNLEGTDAEGMSDGPDFLGLSEYRVETIQKIMDRIAKDDFQDPFGDNIVAQLSDSCSESIRDGLGRYYRMKESQPNIFKFPPIPYLINTRFDAYKNFMDGMDEIAEKMGFDSQEDEIASKRDLIQKQKQFDKERSKIQPSITLPDPDALIIMNRTFYDKLDQPRYALANKDVFSTRVNKGGDVFVIPAVHAMQGRKAVDMLKLLKRNENSIEGSTIEWRREGVKQAIKNFKLKYGLYPQDILDSYGDFDDKYVLASKDDNNLKQANVNVKVNQEGNIPPLYDEESFANKISGEPWSAEQANGWSVNTPDAEKKRFDAYDWNKYSAEFNLSKDTKKEVVKLITAGNTFADAIVKVVESDAYNTNVLARAAGVEDLFGSSSNSISNGTNWNNLARHLGIEPGVNDQGVNLLKKVYDQYDSDHQWRPEPKPDVVGMDRWAAAVKASHEYIKQNYNDAGGNYFRKNADGSDGDDVSGMYSSSDQSGEPDYDMARRNWPGFENMMQNGITNFIPRGETNNLVDFLNNENNDEVFKANVLQTIRNSEGRLTFQNALAATRRNNESVFAKFDALPLQEQLLKIEKIDYSKINKLHEGKLGRAELKYPERIQTFADKLKAGEEFTLAGGQGSIKLDPDMAMDFENASVASELPNVLKTADGEIIRYSALEKTAEFGSRGGGEEKVSNKGEVAEGILGCGTFARLLVRPSAPVTSADIENVIKQLPTDAPDKGGWHELTLTAQEVDNPIADFFTLTVNLKSDVYKDFIDPKKWPIMQNISAGVVDYVNDNLEKYTNYFQANGKVDTVRVIADGVSGETDTKVDVFLTHSLDGGPERTLQHFDMSVKVGSTKQMGQVGGGTQTDPLSVRYGVLAEMWQKFDVDISTIEQDFLNAETVEQGYKIAYTEAVRQLNSHLTSKEKEQEFLMTLLNAIKFFATLNDDRVKLVQFTDLKAGGYYVLDFKKLDRMFDKDKVDLEAKIIETAKHPKITIFNKVTNKDFLSIRMYQASSGYIRNYIEKEKGLVDLTKVRGSGMRKKVESVKEGAVPNNDTIRKLKEIFAKPLLTNDIKSQMNAYVAIPDPSMIRDFRAARASYGDNHDLRSIVKSYAKLKLHNDIKKQLSK